MLGESGSVVRESGEVSVFISLSSLTLSSLLKSQIFLSKSQKIVSNNIHRFLGVFKYVPCSSTSSGVFLKRVPVNNV